MAVIGTGSGRISPGTGGRNGTFHGRPSPATGPTPATGPSEESPFPHPQKHPGPFSPAPAACCRCGGGDSGGPIFAASPPKPLLYAHHAHTGPLAALYHTFPHRTSHFCHLSFHFHHSAAYFFCYLYINTHFYTTSHPVAHRNPHARTLGNTLAVSYVHA